MFPFHKHLPRFPSIHNASKHLTRFLSLHSHHSSDTITTQQELPLHHHHHHHQVGLRFCIWVALKFETLFSQRSRNLTSRILSANNWFSLYWEALQLLKESGILITSESVRALIRAYSTMGLAEEAVECFGRMSELDCKPDTHAYNTILRVVLRKDLFVLAFAVDDMMLKSNCFPDGHTCNLLVDALEIPLRWTRGIYCLALVFMAIISGLCKGKKVDEAHRLFNTMKARGCRLIWSVIMSCLMGFAVGLGEGGEGAGNGVVGARWWGQRPVRAEW